jgi:hypothetical protein
LQLTPTRVPFASHRPNADLASKHDINFGE